MWLHGSSLPFYRNKSSANIWAPALGSAYIALCNWLVLFTPRLWVLITQSRLCQFFFLNLKTDSVLFNLPGATAVDTFPRKEEIQPSGPAIRSHREKDLKGSHLGDCDGSLAI